MAEPESMTAKEMQGRHARMLGRLAELGMTLAEDLHARGLAAETPAEAQAMADAFHKLSRSVRQSLALEARLHRDSQRAERELVCEAEARASAPVQRKRAQARASLARLVWTEAEDVHTYRHWNEGIDRLLEAAECEPDFLEKPVDRIVEDLAQALKANRPPANTKLVPPPISAVEWRLIRPDDEANPPPKGEVSAKPTEGVEGLSASAKPTEGVEGLSASALNPLSRSATAPPEGEHPPPDPPRPRGLPGEFPPWEC